LPLAGLATGGAWHAGRLVSLSIHQPIHPGGVAHRRGAHEAPVARPSKYGGESERPTPLRPSLKKHHAMEPVYRTDRRNGSCDPSQLRRCAGSNRLLLSRLAVGRLLISGQGRGGAANRGLGGAEGARQGQGCVRRGSAPAGVAVLRSRAASHHQGYRSGRRLESGGRL
jgi:hypothetical protein